MARPIKTGLMFFPIDTGFFDNWKIKKLLRDKGANGVCVFIASLCCIYKEQGYYADADRKFFTDVGLMTGVNEQEVAEIIAFCIEMNLFSEKKFLAFHILTAWSIQRQFAYSMKRSRTGIREEYAVEEWQKHDMPLFNTKRAEVKDPVSGTETIVNGTETPVNGTETPVNGTETPVNGMGLAGVNGTETIVNGTETPVNGTETPVNGTKSAQTIKDIIINLKEKKHGNKSTNANGNKSTPAGQQANHPSGTTSDAERRAELQRLRAKAIAESHGAGRH